MFQIYNNFVFFNFFFKTKKQIINKFIFIYCTLIKFNFNLAYFTKKLIMFYHVCVRLIKIFNKNLKVYEPLKFFIFI